MIVPTAGSSLDSDGLPCTNGTEIQAAPSSESEKRRQARCEHNAGVSARNAVKNDILRRYDRRRSVVDLSEASSIDATTLAELIKLRRSLNGAGAALRLIVPAKFVRLFEITGLRKLFELEGV